MPNVEEIKGHIVFDCDGTLISSQEGIIKGIQQLFSEVLKRDVARSEIVDKYTADMHDLAWRFGLNISDDNVRNALLKRWIEISNHDMLKYVLFDEMRDLLIKLTNLGYRLYVWTARDRMSTLSILKSLDVAKFFYEFRCLDDTIPKPHPIGLEEMLGDVDRSKVMMIGDSITDIEGAKNFGCKSIGAFWCTHVDEGDLEKIGPNFMAKTPNECLEIIESEIK